MNLASIIRELAAAGAPPEAIAIAVEAIELARDQATALALAPKASALRMRRKRERDAATDKASLDASQGVTCDAQVTDHVTVEPSPAPPPLFSPHTPQITPPPHPLPDGNHASTREAARSVSSKPRWPKASPPPPGVSDDQWAGFIVHRLAKRQPLTPRAYDLLVGKLAKSSSDEWPPGRIIDTIVERGWIAFEIDWILKGISNGKRPHHDRPSGPIESRRRFREQHDVEPDLGFGAG